MDKTVMATVNLVSVKNKSIQLKNGAWLNAVGGASGFITPELKNKDVELTMSTDKAFSKIVIKGNGSNLISKQQNKDNDNVAIIRQNSLTQSNEFLRTCQVGGLLEGLTVKDMEEMLFKFAEKSESWVRR